MHHAYAITEAKDGWFLILHLCCKDEEESVRLEDDISISANIQCYFLNYIGHKFKHMKQILSIAFLLTACASVAQFCNTSGNVIIYANYDGGAITINVDQDIPNLHIGVCTYEDCAVTITGPFAGNVTEVLYAGYQGNNDNCNTGNTSTAINAPSGVATSVLFAPPSVLPDTDGYGSIICAYSCGTGNQGGCNTAEQVVAYFLNQFGGNLYYYYTQYNCWAGSTLSVSQGGNCCPGVQPQVPVTSIQVNTSTGCTGSCFTFNSTTSGDATQWSWQFPGGSVNTSSLEDPGEVCFDQPGSYTVSLSASNALGSSTASVLIEVLSCDVPGCMYPQAVNFNPEATVDDLSCSFLCTDNCPGDFDANGIIGVSDLLIFISIFGTTCPN